jgi:hypothetical protein
VPTVIYSGGSDQLADPTDVDTLVSSLPKDVLLERVNIASYAHLDFAWGPNAHEDVYKSLMRHLPQGKCHILGLSMDIHPFFSHGYPMDMRHARARAQVPAPLRPMLRMQSLQEWAREQHLTQPISTFACT